MKRNYKNKLDDIIKISNTLLKTIDNGTNDVDDVCYQNFKESYDILDNCLNIVLSNQKKRGKEFLSDNDIDNIIDKAISESKMKHLKSFNENNSTNKVDLFINRLNDIFDMDDFEDGDEPSNVDILSDIGDACNDLDMDSDDIKRVIDMNLFGLNNRYIKIIYDDTLKSELDKTNINIPKVNSFRPNWHNPNK